MDFVAKEIELETKPPTARHAPASDSDPAQSIEGSIPAKAREVSDVTGAGDTVVATLTLAIAAGATIAEAAVLANHAAGIVVGKFGPATVAPDELIASFR